MMAAAVAILAAVVDALPALRRLFAFSAGDKTKRTPRPLPPAGSIGLPVVGQTLSFLRALRANTAEEWLRRRAAAYGPVSRLSLFGCPTAHVVGPAANKFLFASAAVTSKSSESMARMVGRRTIRDVLGDEHRRVPASGP
ncbi:taxoid 7-beta-hydroxylase-like [Setaria italica]|uniref:taxoid 7-beta-hydroxylase-like n=1 Tax=Setaria italica TaxID=4555 RepID=UPI000BE5273E|nr:taxoid 7-beta-hydroxylase-like [Setaria italica]